jgi:hypothetical protein
VFKDLQNKFQCTVPKGSLMHSDVLSQHFNEFYITTEPDPEDFADLFMVGNGDEQLHDLANCSKSKDSSGSSDSEDDEDKDITDNSHDSSISANTPQNDNPPANEQTGTYLPRHDSDCDGIDRKPPLISLAKKALADLEVLLHLKRKKGPGHVDPELNLFVRTCMEGMQTFLNFYVDIKSITYNKWGASSLQAAISSARGRYCA